MTRITISVPRVLHYKGHRYASKPPFTRTLKIHDNVLHTVIPREPAPLLFCNLIWRNANGTIRSRFVTLLV